MLTGRVNAPEINTPHGWLNTDRAYTLRDFRGRLVLLDFWTLGCINCQHLLPDLKRLEREYAQELVVIGIHSPKFPTERNQETLRQALLKFGITHPVVNDADLTVWKQYAIRAWPTVVLLDPNGKIVGQKSGEGIYDTIKPHLENLIQSFGHTLHRTPFPILPNPAPTNVLSFPSKLTLDAKAGVLYLSDSGHHRILKLDFQGHVQEIIGSGHAELRDGNYTEASFQEPHGLAMHGWYLYVADTKNNALRKIDLQAKTVKTLAGTGALQYYFFYDQLDTPVLPNSPWDVIILDQAMYVANAGNHQILRMDLREERLLRYAGTGHEALADGSLREAAFNQPSGLAALGHKLYIADPEASAVRELDTRQGTINTLIGQGLFVFGDQDGDFDEALLQHPMGLTAQEGKLYLADTYNGKIKVLDLALRESKTLLDGLAEPNDVLYYQGTLWFTNTNAHQLMKYNLETGILEEVEVQLPPE